MARWETISQYPTPATVVCKYLKLGSSQHGQADTDTDVVAAV